MDRLLFIYIFFLEAGHGYMRSLCPEPQPVPNSYRTWHPDNVTGLGVMTYRCMDGHPLTSGSLTRTCAAVTTGPNSYGFLDEPPTCTLDCRTPRNISVTTPNWNSTQAGSLVAYTCMNDYFLPYFMLGIRSCDTAMGQWDNYDQVFCRAQLDLTNSMMAQSPNTTAIPAALALDGDPSTCSDSGYADTPTWSIAFSQSQLFDIQSVHLTLKMHPADDPFVELIADVYNGLKSFCGPLEMTNLTHLPDDRVHGVIYCSPHAGRPFGRNVTLKATFPPGQPGRLSVCHVEIKGRPHEAKCDYPPRLPFLGLIDNGKMTFEEGDVMTYECEDGYTNMQGSGRTRCDYKSEWSSPTLVCIGDVIVNVTSLGGSRKTCKQTETYDGGQYVSCDQRPVGTEVRIRVLGPTVPSDGMFTVFGRPYAGALECILTEKATSYKGRLNVTGSGQSCDPWTSSWITGNMLPDDTIADAQNFCRNPDGLKRWPFCYVPDPVIKFEYCDLLLCENMCKRRPDGRDYAGTYSKTASGKQCISWAQKPDPPFPRPKDFPHGLIGSSCRNPSSSQSRPWCYVEDMVGVISDVEGPHWSGLPYDHCDVADCPTSASIVRLAQSDVVNYPEASRVKECHSVNVPHFRSGMPLFAREVCEGNYGQNMTTMCQFQLNVTSVFWSYVIIFCDVLYSSESTTHIPFLTPLLTTAWTSSSVRPSMRPEVTTSTETVSSTSFNIISETQSFTATPVSDLLTEIYTSLTMEPSSVTAAVSDFASESSRPVTVQPTPTPQVSTTAPPLKFLAPKPCVCRSLLNVTRTLLPEEVASLTKSLESELKVSTQNLSRTVRSKTSAVDNRPTAVTVGSFGVFLLTIAVLLVMAGDIVDALVRSKRALIGRGQ
ncbi:hypothetical protein BaRGS_00009804 [Batillaria attramentaria]|uniref:Uncharacterized protein n=1 Tax=Batillaria attramentaria TaxID=370345 RepID=A0ABD0LHN3_9CAEN